MILPTISASATTTAILPTIPGPARGLAPASPVLAFLVDLGEAMIASGDPVTHINASLAQVAAINGAQDAQIVVMPTALIVSVPVAGSVHTAVSAAGANPLRLDQIDAVFRIVEQAERGDLDPRRGLVRLAEARALRPAFRPRTRVFGYTILTAGLALIMRASWTELIVACILGSAVGLLQYWGGRLPSAFRVLIPVVSAFGVSVAVFVLGRLGLDLGGLAALIAPLVTFLPGALLTTAVIELSTGQIVSGSGRLAAGGMRMVLLALGVIAGAQLVGIPGVVGEVASQPLGALAPWIGVAVFGAGVVVFNSARPDSLGWILLVLYVAYAGQVIGGLFFGGVLSAFIGAVLMTPVAMFVASQKNGPPTLVSFMPAFWLLVPGALGLVGVTKMLGEDPAGGMTALVTSGATMIGIALGVLIGLAAGSAFVDQFRSR